MRQHRGEVRGVLGVSTYGVDLDVEVELRTR